MHDVTLIGENPNSHIAFTRHDSGKLVVRRETQSAFSTDTSELTLTPNGRVFLDTVQYESCGVQSRGGYKPHLVEYFSDLYRRLQDRDEGLQLGGKLERKSFLQLQKTLDELCLALPVLDSNSPYRQQRFR